MGRLLLRDKPAQSDDLEPAPPPDRVRGFGRNCSPGGARGHSAGRFRSCTNRRAGRRPGRGDGPSPGAMTGPRPGTMSTRRRAGARSRGRRTGPDRVAGRCGADRWAAPHLCVWSLFDGLVLAALDADELLLTAEQLEVAAHGTRVGARLVGLAGAPPVPGAAVAPHRRQESLPALGRGAGWGLLVVHALIFSRVGPAPFATRPSLLGRHPLAPARAPPARPCPAATRRCRAGAPSRARAGCDGARSRRRDDTS